MSTTAKSLLMAAFGLISLTAVFGPAIAVKLKETRNEAENRSRANTSIGELSTQVAALTASLSQRLEAIEHRLDGLAGKEIVSEGEERGLLQQVDLHASDGNTAALKEALDLYLARFPASPNAEFIRRMRLENAVVGNPSPDHWHIQRVFQGPPQAGLGSDDPTVLLFWETWCPHCRTEAPKMQQLYDDMKNEGLRVVGLTEVNGDATEAQVEAFIEESGIRYPVARIDADLKSHFNVSGVPAAAVIDNGRIVWRGHPARLSTGLLRNLITAR